MPVAAANRSEAPATIHTDLGAHFVSLELSRSKWLITSLSPGGGEKMSKYSVAAGDVAACWRGLPCSTGRHRRRLGNVLRSS